MSESPCDFVRNADIQRKAESERARADARESGGVGVFQVIAILPKTCPVTLTIGLCRTDLDVRREFALKLIDTAAELGYRPMLGDL